MKKDCYETEEYRGFTICIEQEEDPMNPRTEWDNLGTIAYSHRNYILGEEEISSATEFLSGLIGEEEDDLLEKFYRSNPSYTEPGSGKKQAYMDWLMTKAEKNHIILPVYLYDHSGITISTGPFSCPWDSGQVGYIYVSYEKLREEYGWKNITKSRIKKATEYLENEIKTFDDYLTGCVFGFTIEDQDEEIIHSCSGYFGDAGMKQIISECHSVIDDEITKRRNNRFNTIKTWIRSRVPLNVRMEKLATLY